jgi:hypothetical protein
VPAERDAPTNCQQEPSYPGAETVVFSIRFPELTCHRPTKRCQIEAPHAIAECDEWTGTPLEVALAMRGRAWGSENADRLMLMHTCTRSPQSHGGPCLQGRHWIAGGFRRLAPPAP